MKPFLYQVASLFYSEYGAEVSRLAFVFPNRRTGLFFQKYLSEVSEKPLFSPTILTINDLFVQLSGKQAADRISMLFKLYDIYLRHSGSSETFDEFLYWGEMLLNDFDDIDKYMADARMHTGICHIFIDIVKIIQQHFPPIQELVERFGRTAMSQINII